MWAGSVAGYVRAWRRFIRNQRTLTTHGFQWHAQSHWNRRILACIFFASISWSADAALITTVNFNDDIWQVNLSESGTAQNTSSYSADSMSARKGNGAGGTRIEIALNAGSSLSTVGFQNISIAFSGLTQGILEWNGDLSGGVASTDGLSVVGSGVAINANVLNDISGTPAADEFASDGVVPTSFPTANFHSDFSFGTSVNNSSINDLLFILQVNAKDEQLTISKIQILGDPIATVAEPGSFLAFAILSTFGLAMHRRRNWKPDFYRMKRPGCQTNRIELPSQLKILRVLGCVIGQRI